jgi:UDP-N-acetylmuramate--alanine ligase
VIAIAQPHRYTRLRDLLGEFQSCFNDADMVFVAPVYPAGEQPIPGVDSAALVGGLRERGHRAAAEIASASDLAERLKDLIAPGDLVVCLGAGDITQWAAGLAADIASRRAPSTVEGVA